MAQAVALNLMRTLHIALHALSTPPNGDKKLIQDLHYEEQILAADSGMHARNFLQEKSSSPVLTKVPPGGVVTAAS